MVNTQAKHSYADLTAKTEEEDVVLGQLLQVIMDDIWLLLGIAVTVVALAGLYCYVAKPVYQADVHVRGSELDHTIVRPGRLTDDAPTGRIKAARHVGRGTISRADVASVLAAVLADDTTVGRTFEVIGGEERVADAIPALADQPDTRD